eukprot:3830728-Rhodomonas_salina.3
MCWGVTAPTTRSVSGSRCWLLCSFPPTALPAPSAPRCLSAREETCRGKAELWGEVASHSSILFELRSTRSGRLALPSSSSLRHARDCNQLLRPHPSHQARCALSPCLTRVRKERLRGGWESAGKRAHLSRAGKV